MIRVLPEGEKSRWGVNLHLYRKRLEAVTINFSHRFILRLGGQSPGLWLNFTLDHKMYRPNDMDGGLLFCRRCHEYSDTTRSHCRGRTFAWSSKTGVVFAK